MWLEIWNDCAPMGDHAQYREIVTKLFIEGKPAWEITYQGYDDKGKKVTKRLASRPLNPTTSTSATSDARALFDRLKRGAKVDTRAFVEQVNAAKAAVEVASPPSE